MTIYVDQLMRYGQESYHGSGRRQAARVGAKHGHLWCHLISDDASGAELHMFAAMLGMKRTWFQGDHYDLVPSRRSKAIELGAIELDRRSFCEIRRKLSCKLLEKKELQ